MSDFSDAVASARAQQAAEAQAAKDLQNREMDRELWAQEQASQVIAEFMELAKSYGLEPDLHITDRMIILQQDAGPRFGGWHMIKGRHHPNASIVKCWAIRSGLPPGHTNVLQVNNQMGNYYLLDDKGQRRITSWSKPEPALINLRTFESRQRRELSLKAIKPSVDDVAYTIYGYGNELSDRIYLKKALTDYILKRTNLGLSRGG